MSDFPENEFLEGCTATLTFVHKNPSNAEGTITTVVNGTGFIKFENLAFENEKPSTFHFVSKKDSEAQKEFTKPPKFSEVSNFLISIHFNNIEYEFSGDAEGQLNNGSFLFVSKKNETFEFILNLSNSMPVENTPMFFFVYQDILKKPLDN